MKTRRFGSTIDAPRQIVWDTMFQDMWPRALQLLKALCDTQHPDHLRS